MSTGSLPVLTSNEFSSNQDVRWCPGCGDFSILAQIKNVLAEQNIPREKIVFVSGNGCSSRLPYYLSTYGFHGIHGRAPALATGLKMANPDLQVWVITGDGDGLAIGAAQLAHAIRRNVDIKILLFNNEVFGLTKGQFSVTSRQGTPTVSSPAGSIERPLHPLSFALGAEATFVARTLDMDINHMNDVFHRAARHRGTAFVEIYQNCKIFNDGVFDYATDPSIKANHTIFLEQGRPLIFGKDRNQGIRLNGFDPEVVTLANGITMDDLLIHDERAEHPTLAFLLSRLIGPDFPECFGVFRSVLKPTFEQILLEQRESARRANPTSTLQDLLVGADSWRVE